MSPRPALLFSLLLAILAPFYCLVDRPAAKIASFTGDRESLLNLDTVDAVTLRRGAQTVSYRKISNGRDFRLLEPENKFLPQDLMQALAALLLRLKSVEVVSDDPSDLVQFGLARPSEEIVVQSAHRATPIEIFFGSENPAHTAIYARIKGVPKIFLLGKELEYYQTLMFQWLEREQGRNR